tara:strand:- start:16116 stop:17030 length:915 start_codon:yes stop_codon:yes gene_type:complete
MRFRFQSSAWKPSEPNILRGILLMCVTAIIMFPLLNATVKFLVTDFNVWQIVWVRSIAHFGVMAIFFMPKMGPIGLFRTAHPIYQGLRSVFQLLAMLLYFSALEKISLPTVTAIGFTAPLMVVAFSVPILGEHVGFRRWGAVIIGFIGALIIIRPGSDLTDWAVFYVLAGAFCYAVYQALTRKVSEKDAPGITAIYTVLLALIVSSIFAPFDLNMPMNLEHWLAFIGLGLFGAIGHFFLIKAYSLAEASIISPFDYGQLIGAAIIGYMVWGDFPDLWTWIGAGILILSGIYITRYEGINKKDLK